jgi:hypothetical protein
MNENPVGRLALPVLPVIKSVQSDLPFPLGREIVNLLQGQP